MRKVWIFKRQSVRGWWVGWYESGKRKAKALPTKALADHYRQIKYRLVTGCNPFPAHKVLVATTVKSAFP